MCSTTKTVVDTRSRSELLSSDGADASCRRTTSHSRKPPPKSRYPSMKWLNRRWNGNEDHKRKRRSLAKPFYKMIYLEPNHQALKMRLCRIGTDDERWSPVNTWTTYREMGMILAMNIRDCIQNGILVKHIGVWLPASFTADGNMCWTLKQTSFSVMSRLCYTTKTMTII